MTSLSLTSVSLTSVIAGAAIASIVGFLLLHSSKRTYKGLPFNPGLPIIGHLLSLFVGDPRTATTQLRSDHGDAFVTEVLFGKVYNIFGEAGNRWIFRGEGKYTILSPPPHWLKLLGDNSLSGVHGAKHRSLRQLLAPGFSPRALEACTPRMERLLASSLENLAKVNSKGFEFFPEIKKATFEVAVNNFLNYEPGKECDELLALYRIWLKPFGTIFPINLPFFPFWNAMKARKEIKRRIELLVQERREKGFQTEIFDFIGALINSQDDEGKSLTDNEISDQILTLIFAGHDTSSNSTCTLITVLSEHPEVAKRLREEIDQEILDSEPLTFQKVHSLPYLEAFVKEILRAYPPVGGGFRRTTEDTPFNENVIIPKGSLFIYNIFEANKTGYTNPLDFDPDRFLEPRREDQNATYNFLTFGSGPRTCIGNNFARLETKIFIILLLKNFEFEVLESKTVIFPFFSFHPRIKLSKRTK